MTPRGPDKQFDREKALDRALELFWRQGYEGTGVSELLKAMGIGRQSMYDTFGGKRDLFLASLREYGRREVGRIVSHLRASGSPLANLNAMLDALESPREVGCEYGCFIGNAIAELGARDEDVAAMVRGGLDMIQGAVRETLQRAREVGELKEDADLDGLTNLMISSLQGTALLTKVNQDMEFGRTALRGLRAALAAA